MDRKSLARLTNSCKNPLGRVGEILEQQFLEEKREERHDMAKCYIIDAEDASRSVSETNEDWFNAYLEEEQIYCRTVARRLTNPLERCSVDGCRNAPHRFATWDCCTLHHKD
jgi:hypothetical protein